MSAEKNEALRLADLWEKHSHGYALTPEAKTAAELRRLSAELERERMRLAACGVVALADTPDSAKHARQMHPDYESAACQDVARRVDECISLRAQRDALLEALRAIVHAATVHACHHALSVDGQQFYDIARAAIAKAEEA